MTQRFGEESTADQILDGVDLGGVRVLVTGVSSGIGVETARALVARRADVVGAARDLSKAGIATKIVNQAMTSGGRFALQALDLASLESVRAAVDRLSMDAPFDLIIANAGLMAPPFGRTVDGFEAQFGTNHLGHFLLINRLVGDMPAGGRVVVLASSAHHIADVDLDDPNFERASYSPFIGYGASKTANILFVAELDRRWRDRGIRAVAVHPGSVATDLGRHVDPAALAEARKLASGGAQPARPAFRKTVAQGAATSLWAALVAPAEAVGGQYAEDCALAERVPAGVRRGITGPGVAAHALDPERARRLWTISEAMVGEAFPEP